MHSPALTSSLQLLYYSADPVAHYIKGNFDTLDSCLLIYTIRKRRKICITCSKNLTRRTHHRSIKVPSQFPIKRPIGIVIKKKTFLPFFPPCYVKATTHTHTHTVSTTWSLFLYHNSYGNFDGKQRRDFSGSVISPDGQIF